MQNQCKESAGMPPTKPFLLLHTEIPSCSVTNLLFEGLLCAVGVGVIFLTQDSNINAYIHNYSESHVAVREKQKCNIQ